MDLSAAVPEVGYVSTWAASIAITAALALGIYYARWLRAEQDEIGARASLAKAVKVMWRARWALAVVVVIGWLVVHAWFRKNGAG
jgi:TRAP-type C4-dicarboxylate transport system permease large subunit